MSKRLIPYAGAELPRLAKPGPAPIVQPGQHPLVAVLIREIVDLGLKIEALRVRREALQARLDALRAAR